MPKTISAPGITSLNLSRNCLKQVPSSVWALTTLKYLNFHDNPNLKTLPPDVSMLNNLGSLQLNGKATKSLVYKTMMQENPFDHIPDKLTRVQGKQYSKGSLCTQLMIIGDDDRDKCAHAAMLATRH